MLKIWEIYKMGWLTFLNSNLTTYTFKEIQYKRKTYSLLDEQDILTVHNHVKHT